MRIGIVCVQGAFIEHKKILESLGCECVELRQKSDIKNLDGIVLPGGESTVQGKLLKELEMLEELKKLIDGGINVLATCAGVILLAEKISNDKNKYFATLPVTVERNAYGRQTASFEKSADFNGIGQFPMTFIRAPVITEVCEEVKILAKMEGKICAVEYKNQIALTFHPELTENNRIHKYFIEKIRAGL